MSVALLIVPVISTLLGGWLALRAQRYLPLLLALGAGLLLGAAFLDLLPEAIALAETTGQQSGMVPTAVLLAFLGFLSIETICDGIGQLQTTKVATRKTLGRISGSLLILHSFRDGMVIGAAYSASHTAGLTVACGIVAHDVGDGMNTVLLSTAGDRAMLFDYAFLAADAIAPFLGGVLTIWWVQSPQNAVVLLAIAAGFFLQMATTDFLPELRAYTASRSYVIPLILLGVGMIYAANALVHLQ